MAYTHDQWDTVRALYERGLSLAEIVARDEVSVKSKSQISKRAHLELWEKGGKKKQLLDREIKSVQEVTEIKEQKETLKETELQIHNALVDERTKHLEFYKKGNLIIASKILTKVRTVDLSVGELSQAAAGFGRTQEGVLGKSPDTAIQINNSVPTLADFYNDQDVPKR
jgi:predicted DNA-binding protein YlxM (UPF0122 family)